MDRRPSNYWIRKFGHAFRGVWQEVCEDRSFRVHFSMAAAVIVSAIVFRVTLIEWCILLGCITLVLTAELVNSALESMAKAITDEHDPRVGAALDIGSAAVLLAAIGSSIIGGIIFLRRLGQMLGWWA
jgi:diacylglycerol kinase